MLFFDEAYVQKASAARSDYRVVLRKYLQKK